MWTEIWPVAVYVSEFAIRIGLVAFILTRRQFTPQSTLAWIAVILALPLVGIALYLLFGEIRLGRHRIQRYKEIVRRIEGPQSYVALEGHPPLPQLPGDAAHLSRLIETIGRHPARAGNALELISGATDFISKLVHDINNAREHCHLTSYIYLCDSSGQAVAKALINAAKRGVACRVLVDAVGSRSFLRSTLRQQMEAAGVRVVEALPAKAIRMLFARQDLRNHRKLVVIDHRIGYVGSQNIADAAFAIKKRFAPWVDASVRIVGPATWDLQVLFVEDWYLDTDESLDHLLLPRPLPVVDGVPVQIFGTSPLTYTEAMQQLSQALFHSARDELILTTPYFVPDEATLSALMTIARRGVDTTLIVPARNDSRLVGAASRSHYLELLEAEIKICEFTAGLLHAKTVTVDRSLGLISSANLDRRSFELNLEVSMMVYDNDFSSELRLLQKSYLNNAREIELHEWKLRSWPFRLWQNAAGTLSPLL